MTQIIVRQDIDTSSICSTKMPINITGESIRTNAWYIYEKESKYLFMEMEQLKITQKSKQIHGEKRIKK